MPQHGKGGRKRTHPNLKVVKGTDRPDRDSHSAPDPASDAPRAPAWISREAVQHFGNICARLEGIGLSSSSYTETVALAAERLAEIEQADALIAHHGRVYETTNSQNDRALKANPAVAQRNEAMRHLHSLLSECGLTPASISKVGGAGGKKAENPFAGIG
jgi:P27 family predicted phage terminase small subunit